MRRSLQKWNGNTNALRHSFISYRVAITKNVHQVSLEAGNSPQMVFAHYRQLVTETQAKEWFGTRHLRNFNTASSPCSTD